MFFYNFKSNCSVDLVVSDKSGVEIDYCPKCHNIWFDHRELDKIIEHSIFNSGNFHQISRQDIMT
ncbi:TPA: zf-TFIIB domain-containing protein [Campylobacter jejuni]|nr:zf-TFIIB domain-containing protein [Campylobacter jejuni]HDZ4937171.1 zf-TFIIB domain-containing protein [Campylobacter jejuni]HDZ4939661.1 zf-TFIIB domain-containing protein [Campylobacter jejuni]HDZ4943477.1 zf-TFIIB domain-containing protein [Campylobacter jejuni]HDZ4945264.1 zf-TFIIB domain-containing protein [Campylobacter jejuni]